MVRVRTLLSGLALVAFAACAVTFYQRQSAPRAGTFRIPVTKSYRKSTTRNYELAAVQDIKIPLFNYGETMYLCPMMVGSNKQPFIVTADTGSSNVWMMSAASCDGCDGKSVHHKFNASQSTSYKDENLHVSLKYGTGSAEGALFSDSLAVGNVSVTQKMSVMTHVTAPFPDSQIDGILGLAFDGISSPPGPNAPAPWLYVLQQSKTLNSVVFHFDMTNDGTTGDLVFGALPQDLQSGVVNWLPVVEFKKGKGLGYWMVAMDGYSVGKNTTEGHMHAAVDSGTSYIIMPQPAFDELNKKIPANPPCSGEGLPDLVITMGGVHYVLEGKDYVVPLESGAKGCELGLAPAPVGALGPIDWLLGDTFHRKFSVAYDFDGQRVGLPGKRAAAQEPLTAGISVTSLLFLLAICAIISGFVGLRVGMYVQRKQARGPMAEEDMQISMQPA